MNKFIKVIPINTKKADFKLLSTEELRDLVVKICKLKDKALTQLLASKSVKIPYMTQEDYEDLSNWTSEDYIRYLEEVLEAADSYYSISDCIFCSWCSKYLHKNDDKHCDGCTYGERHGLCINKQDHSEGTYKKIKTFLGYSIYMIPDLLNDTYNTIEVFVKDKLDLIR